LRNINLNKANRSWLGYFQPHKTTGGVGHGSLIACDDGLRGETVADLPELLNVVAAREPRAGEIARHFRDAGDVGGSFDFLIGQCQIIALLFPRG
jgi:hypothetical protein